MLRFAARAVAIAAAITLTGAVMADDTTLNVKVGDKFPEVALKGRPDRQVGPARRPATR